MLPITPARTSTSAWKASPVCRSSTKTKARRLRSPPRSHPLMSALVGSSRRVRGKRCCGPSARSRRTVSVAMRSSSKLKGSRGWNAGAVSAWCATASVNFVMMTSMPVPRAPRWSVKRYYSVSQRQCLLIDQPALQSREPVVGLLEPDELEHGIHHRRAHARERFDQSVTAERHVALRVATLVLDDDAALTELIRCGQYAFHHPAKGFAVQQHSRERVEAVRIEAASDHD